MDWKEQLEICYKNYKKWKGIALNSFGLEAQKAMERAFFWLEIHSAIFAIGTVENTKEKDRETVLKLIEAKKRIVEKLTEYSKTLIGEL